MVIGWKNIKKCKIYPLFLQSTTVEYGLLYWCLKPCVLNTFSGKAAKYRLLWIGNEKGLKGAGIFLDKVIDITRASERMIVIKVLVQGIISA